MTALDALAAFNRLWTAALLSVPTPDPIAGPAASKCSQAAPPSPSGPASLTPPAAESCKELSAAGFSSSCQEPNP